MSSTFQRHFAGAGGAPPYFAINPFDRNPYSFDAVFDMFLANQVCALSYSGLWPWALFR